MSKELKRKHYEKELEGLQRELLDASVHAGAYDGLVELHLGLPEGGFGAGLLGWQ